MGVGLGELILVTLVAILCIKPQNIPDIIYFVTRLVTTIKTATTQLSTTIKRELSFTDANQDD